MSNISWSRITRSLWIIALALLTGCASATAPRPAPVTALPSIEQKAPASTAPLTGVRKTVVIADFEGGSVPPREETAFWNRALASLLIADLRHSENLKVIDRHYLAAILREQRLSASDLSDPATRLRIGRIIGANFFIFGTYTILGDDVMLVARMDDVETSQIVKAEQVAGKADEMRLLSRKLSVAFLQGLDHRLAVQEEKRLGEVGGPPLEAVRHFSEGLDYEAEGAYDKAVEMYTKALTLYPKYQEAREHLETASEQSVR